ncbi:DUF4397 domain-containing protein [Inquilinus sp. KBS0705]|nr:DUF4397 domain-containing protein [Inquilinus sp. KBS0705]
MNSKLPVIIVLVLALGFAACKKNDDVPADDNGLVTDLNVVNATADTLNFYINGTRINNTSSLYPQGASGYIGVPYGQQNYQFRRIGSPIVLFTKALTLDTLQSYTLFLAGTTDENTLLTIDTIKSNDKTARVRFVNTTPDIGALDVTVGDTVKFKARAFKTATVFLNVNAGTKRVRIYKAGTATLLSDETRILDVGGVYTLFTKGRTGGSGDAKFGTGLNVNK